MDGDQKAKKGISEKRSVKKGSKGKAVGFPEADLTAAATGTDLPAAGSGPETPSAVRPKAARSLGAEHAKTVKIKEGVKRKAGKAETVPVLSQAGAADVATSEEPSFDQIQLRAYFIAERRRKTGEAGDESSDWLRAKEELQNEVAPR